MASHPGVVRDGVLTLADGDGDGTIPVESAAWWAWLAAPGSTGFRFVADAGAFTARREAKPGGWYWYAYRRQGGRLHKRYLGRDADLTLDRLHAAARLLAPEAPVPALPPPPATPPTPAPLPDLLLATKILIPPARPELV